MKTRKKENPDNPQCCRTTQETEIVAFCCLIKNMPLFNRF